MDYGEPWDNSLGYIRNRDGVDIDGSKQADTRAVDCVNACAGIPTEELKNVKRAWVEQYLRYFFDSKMIPVKGVSTILYANELLDNNVIHWGELNQLIRECR